MGVHVVSLQETVDQTIPSGGGYTLLKFSYTPIESYDVHNMHSPEQPDGSIVTNWQTDPRSGLIWPSTAGWGELYASFIREGGDYDEIRDQFARAPLGSIDTTAVEHRPPRPGLQYFAKQHGIFVNP